MPKTRNELLADLERTALAFAAADKVYREAWERHGEEGRDKKPLHPETEAAMQGVFAPQFALNDAIRALYDFDNPETSVPLALPEPGAAEVQF